MHYAARVAVPAWYRLGTHMQGTDGVTTCHAARNAHRATWAQPTLCGVRSVMDCSASAKIGTWRISCGAAKPCSIQHSTWHAAHVAQTMVAD